MYFIIQLSKLFINDFYFLYHILCKFKYYKTIKIIFNKINIIKFLGGPGCSSWYGEIEFGNY